MSASAISGSRRSSKSDRTCRLPLLVGGRSFLADRSCLIAGNSGDGGDDLTATEVTYEMQT